MILIHQSNNWPCRDPIHHIIDTVYLGDLRAAENTKILDSYNITHIITVADEINLNLPEKYKVLTLKITDLGHAQLFPLLEYAEEFINIVNNCSKHNNVLVHCKGGMSRSGSVIIYYLMKEKGMTFDEAFNFARSKRYCVNPNDGFKNQLRGYGKELEKMLKNAFDNQTRADKQLNK